jgi:predicted nucleic acid-binding protein
MPGYLIDTNVLLRGAVRTSVRHPMAAGAIAALLARGDELFVTPQVLIEFWSVATRPADVNGLGWSVEVVRGEIDSILGQFPVLPDTPAVFEEWLRLVTEHGVTGKKVHDARLVAVLKTHQVGRLLTFNVGDFRVYDIAAVSPDELAGD